MKDRTQDELDQRRYVLYEDIDHQVIIHEIELVRVIRTLEANGSVDLANKLRKVIYFRDILESTKHDFSRKPSRHDMARLTMTPLEYQEHKREVERIDEDMGVFYELE